MVRNSRGSLSIPLLFLFVALAFAAFGILGVLRNWRGKVAIQLEIDRCVGLAAQELRDSLSHIGQLNEAMVATRASLATIGNIPALRAPLEAALEAEVIAQDALREKWTISMGKWLAMRGCRTGSGDFPKPLPGLDLQRPPPDVLGSKPLDWQPGISKNYTIWLAHPPRYSAATVSPKDPKDENEDSEEQTLAIAAGLSNLPSSWQAVWSDPRGQHGQLRRILSR